MADEPMNAGDLTRLWQDRSGYYGEDHLLADQLVDVYNGGLPDEFGDYFHEDMHIHLPNMIRLAWDDLSFMAGKEFPIFTRPDNDRSAAKERAERLEKIGYGYNMAGAQVGGISMKMLMKVLAWWMVGVGNGVAMALPSFEHQTPFFTFRDPRTHYPPVGWNPYVQNAAADGLFAYQLPVSEVQRRWSLEDSVIEKITHAAPGRRGPDERAVVWVGEYYHADSWIVATLSDQAVQLARSDAGDRGHPDVMPVVSFGLYSPEGPKGRGMFADQISIQAAMARMFSQKLDFYDRTLYPLIFHTPLSGSTIRIGPFATNEYNTTTGVQPRVDTVSPAHQVDADQTMVFAMGLSRMLNRNPESFQGGGDADSAKALVELKSGVTGSIRDGIWPPMVEALPRLYTAAAKIDLKLWPKMRKRATGSRKNMDFFLDYTPERELTGREHRFGVEPGLGLAGYQGTLELMQLYGAEAISEDLLLEQLETVRNSQEEKRRIQADRISKVIFADFGAKAQEGRLHPGALAQLRKRIQQGEDMYDVIEEMEKAGTLVMPPPPEQAAAGVGGAPAGLEGMPAPPLALLRGGA